MQGDFRIAEWLVQPELNSIERAGRTSHVEPKVMQVLLYLARHADQVVPKERLIQAVWADTFVTDDVLTRCISELRKAFDDDPKDPQIIQTIPKSGYRLVAPVAGVTAGTSHPRVGRRAVWVATAVMIVALFVAGYWERERFWPRAHPPAGRIMLAVLPFTNLSGDAEQEYFADGLTEEMISQLGSLQPERMGVIARTSVMQYKGTKKTIRQIGQELGVEYVLESSVQQVADRVRITTQLIRVRDQTHLWSESYDRNLRDILVLRRDVAQAVANAVQLKFTPEQRIRLASTRPVIPQAYELYLKGLYYTEREWSESAYEQGRQFFQKAINADPTYAPSYAALANVYVELCLFGSLTYREAYPKAKAAALKSLELDNNLPEGHAALGNVKFMLEWDWWGPEKDFHRALELHLTSITALRKYVRYLMLTGRANEGLALHKRMIELDPLSTDLRVLLGSTLSYARQYDEGIGHLKEMFDQDPNLPRIAHYHLAWNYALAGKYAEAAAECEKIHSAQTCAYVYAAWGHREKALTFARKNERADPVFTAPAYVALGDKDKALQLLERGYLEHLPDMVYVRAQPELDPLRSDPRFQDLLRRMNFPP